MSFITRIEQLNNKIRSFVTVFGTKSLRMEGHLVMVSTVRARLAVISLLILARCIPC